MYHKKQRDDFIKLIKDSVPTHYATDDTSLLNDLAHIEMIAFSSLYMPIETITDMAMNFVYGYASYTPGSELKKDNNFIIQQPLIIYSPSKESSDRTMIWANGWVSLIEDGTLSLFIDKDLVEILKNEQ